MRRTPQTGAGRAFAIATANVRERMPRRRRDRFAPRCGSRRWRQHRPARRRRASMRRACERDFARRNEHDPAGFVGVRARVHPAANAAIPRSTRHPSSSACTGVPNVQSRPRAAVPSARAGNRTSPASSGVLRHAVKRHVVRPSACAPFAAVPRHRRDEARAGSSTGRAARDTRRRTSAARSGCRRSAVLNSTIAKSGSIARKRRIERAAVLHRDVVRRGGAVDDRAEMSVARLAALDRDAARIVILRPGCDRQRERHAAVRPSRRHQALRRPDAIARNAGLGEPLRELVVVKRRRDGGGNAPTRAPTDRSSRARRRRAETRAADRRRPSARNGRLAMRADVVERQRLARADSATGRERRRRRRPRTGPVPRASAGIARSVPGL